MKAFAHLAEKIKKMYPHLPMIIAADSLYPNDTVFTLCKKNSSDFILFFKEGTLKSLWEEVGLLYPILEVPTKAEKILAKTEEGWLKESIMYIKGMAYKNTLCTGLNIKLELRETPRLPTLYTLPIFYRIAKVPGTSMNMAGCGGRSIR